jgi:IS30 family transposase
LTKRLSEGQKKELVENFKSGKSIDVLSKEFDCTKSTISRNLKKNLGDIKYKELIQKNKSSNEKNTSKKKYNNSLLDKKTDIEGFHKDFIDLKNSEKNRKGLDFVPLDSFIEIAPIEYEMDNHQFPYQR